MSSINYEDDIDAIFHAGGTTSCLIAGRLADADPTLKILILEAGPHTQDNLAHTQPARYLHHLAPNSQTVTFVVANPEKELGDRQTIVPCGHCVGGGSSVNCMYRYLAFLIFPDDFVPPSHDVHARFGVRLRRLGEEVQQSWLGIE